MGTPKSSILIACSILNYPFRGPPFMEPPICDWAMTLQDQTSWKQSLAQCRLCRRSRIERSIWNGPNCLSQISFIIMVTIVVIVDFTRIIVMILYIYMLHEYNKFKMFFQILEWIQLNVHQNFWMMGLNLAAMPPALWGPWQKIVAITIPVGRVSTSHMADKGLLGDWAHPRNRKYLVRHIRIDIYIYINVYLYVYIYICISLL